MITKIRSAAAAGQFYPGSEESLLKQIKENFLDSRGTKKLPKISNKNKKIIGVVVPHAGYIFSGAIASHSFFNIADNGFADTFIILGPNHTGHGSGISVMTEGDWQTPLGNVKINNEIAKKLQKDIIDSDQNAHIYEHSIEVQLPFLQFISKEFDFVPICMMMQDIDTATEVGNIIAESIKTTDKKVVIIASSDFSHVGFNYMSMPPEGMGVDEYAKKQDKLAIDKILKLDAQGLVKTVQENNISMCGYGPVSAMLVAAKMLGASKAELLKYGTSYEVYPNTSCVGYGSIIVY